MKYRTKLIIKKMKLYNIGWYFLSKYYKRRDERIKKRYAGIKIVDRNDEVAIGTNKLSLDKAEPHDYNMLLLIKKGKIYEPEVTNIIIEELKEGQTFMDIGANNGYYTVLASQIVGSQGRVYSIEPNPIAYNRLIKNIEINKLDNVSTYDFALSDSTGSTNLYLDSDDEDGLASLLNVSERNVLAKVNVKKFDEVFGNEIIHFVKMDVEGSEIAILRGMKYYLSVHKKIKIIMEWNETYTSANDFEYLKENFEISLLSWESGKLKKIPILDSSQLVRWCNLLLLLK